MKMLNIVQNNVQKDNMKFQNNQDIIVLKIVQKQIIHLYK